MLQALAPPAPSPSHRASLGLTGLIAVAAAGLVLGACSSSTPSAATTSTTASGNSSGGSSTTSSGGTSDAAKIHSLSSVVQAGSHATFKAVYSSQGSGGSQTITIEQKPPKSVFSSGSGSVINDGTRTYFCSTSGGAQQCVSESTTSNPLQSLTAVFSPQTLLTVFQQAQAAAAAHASGYNISFSDATYAGQPSKCIDFSGSGKTGKYCVTDSGILAYLQTPGETISLTNASSSPPASDFALPSGATVITVPSVPGQ